MLDYVDQCNTVLSRVNYVTLPTIFQLCSYLMANYTTIGIPYLYLYNTGTTPNELTLPGRVSRGG